jgi:hypothetical protein
MPSPRPVPAKRPELFIEYKGKKHPFKLGVNGWCDIEAKIRALTGAGFGTHDARSIYMNLLDSPEAHILRFIVSLGLTTEDTIWSEDESAEVIEEIGMLEAVTLVGQDLAWIYAPRAGLEV